MDFLYIFLAQIKLPQQINDFLCLFQGKSDEIDKNGIFNYTLSIYFGQSSEIAQNNYTEYSYSSAVRMFSIEPALNYQVKQISQTARSRLPLLPKLTGPSLQLLPQIDLDTATNSRNFPHPYPAQLMSLNRHFASFTGTETRSSQ
jgi:hypothetical protein